MYNTKGVKYASEIKIDSDIEYSLELEHSFIGYSKENPILYDISLKVQKGDIVAVIGNSGAGKSTGIRCMTAQIRPISGKVITSHFDVKDQEEVQLRIGYVPQLEYLSLYYDFSALDNALFFGRNFGLKDSFIKQRCQDVMSILGIGEKEFLNKPVKKLSGGERKRVSIMIGLINQPDILFLDEPTTGLDPHLRIEVLNFLLQINQKYQTTILIVSHDLECVDYCNSVVVFADGTMVDTGDPKSMVNSLPNHGKTLNIQFNNLDLKQESLLSQYPEITYLLHVGRNKYKIFGKSDLDFEILLEKLKKDQLKIGEFNFEYCVFLDYFRVNSIYNYVKIAQQIKEAAQIGRT